MRLLLLNLLRKPLRTLLTILGVGVALLLFCFLEAVLDVLQRRREHGRRLAAGRAAQGIDRL